MQTAVVFFCLFTRIYCITVTHRLRDIVDGVKSAWSNALRGSAYGLAAALASPFVLGGKFGLAGFASGCIAGVVMGVMLPVTGFVVGTYQLVRGMFETPPAIVESVFRCRVYDDERRSWVDYSLDEDVEEIRSALKKEKGKRPDIKIGMTTTKGHCRGNGG